ncbi:hypothetical protein E2C01_006578 [Portunus trituberculatus]|uniref:Uncharacterized protein n=1 Tax=Portunus trituberculatus TaxID=210409 RepID=A0A5B7CWM7_PORTR|nr:hypothetical protein [Portunus trituberculatus]
MTIKLSRVNKSWISPGNTIDVRWFTEGGARYSPPSRLVLVIREEEPSLFHLSRLAGYVCSRYWDRNATPPPPPPPPLLMLLMLLY